MEADLLIHSAAQLLTVAAQGRGPKRGAAMSDLGLIPDGAVAVRGGRIARVGPTAALRATVRAAREVDASGKVVMPGFVDPHTHLVWAGDRADEFERRLAGATYQEIMAAGGGIMSTVRATRAASLAEIVAQSRPRLEAMLAHGTTTAEVKTGYGLTLEDELKLLDAITFLAEEHAVTLVPTFLGAHAIPSEYLGRADAYVDLIVEEMLPTVAHLNYRLALVPDEDDVEEETVNYRPAARFCDVFCDEGAFTVEQARRILTAAKRLGLGLKIHADEFAPLGATRLAVTLRATSADHLVCTPPDQLQALARSTTVGVALPGTPFGLGQGKYMPAREFIAAGGALALATDLNPGTCWCESMPFIIALACRAMRLTPAEAIVAATLNAAHAVGLGQKVGSLERGKEADILILDVPDHRHLAYRFGGNPVQAVFKRGDLVAGSL
jgi:imidazolonepropionase